MKRLSALLAPIIFSGLWFAEYIHATSEPKFDPLPAPVSNNAVASVKSRGRLLLFSFMGIGPKKTWDAITNAAYALDTGTGKWSQVRPVPGTTGRIAAVAASARAGVSVRRLCGGSAGRGDDGA